MSLIWMGRTHWVMCVTWQVLREVLHKAGGVQVLDGWSITQAQVDGKGGGDVLRQENASFGSTVKPIRKARSSLQVCYYRVLVCACVGVWVCWYAGVLCIVGCSVV